MAQLKSTNINGNLAVTGDIVASNTSTATLNTDSIASESGGAIELGKITYLGDEIAIGSEPKLMLSDATNNEVYIGPTLSDYATKNYFSAGSGIKFIEENTSKAISLDIGVPATGDVLSVNNGKNLSTSYNNSALTTVEVGGLPKNSNINGWSIKQILDKLLYKYQSPSVGNIKYTMSHNNTSIGGTLTVSQATITLNAGSVTPSIKNSSLSWNGISKAGNNANATLTAFGSKTITFPLDYTWTSSADATRFTQKEGVATIYLTGGNENGSDLTLTKTTKSEEYYFDTSKYYWGGKSFVTTSDYTKANSASSTQRTKLGSGTGKDLTASLNNEAFTLVLPKAWGTTLKVYDGASNPVEGVFKNIKEIKIENENGYEEPYIVWEGAAATGTIKYFFQIS